jgi:hypothetical protein
VPKTLLPVEPPDPRRIARQIRLIGAIVLVAGLLAGGWISWHEWYRTEPTIEEVLPGSEAAASRQMGIMYGPLLQDVWDFYREIQQPYIASVLIVATSALVMLGCRRLARRHLEDAE